MGTPNAAAIHIPITLSMNYVEASVSTAPNSHQPHKTQNLENLP
jgi:hypothetical protein